jgi:hypothetical protein
MNRTLLALLSVLWAGVAVAQAGPVCLFAPAELSPYLGHTPKAGVVSTSRQGLAGCQYGMEDAKEAFFWVRIDEKCSRQAFDRQAKARQSVSGKTNRFFSGVGDGAYFSPGGSAAVRVGARCVELSGLKAGAKRVITEAEVQKLLTLAASRLGK